MVRALISLKFWVAQILVLIHWVVYFQISFSFVIEDNFC